MDGTLSGALKAPCASLAPLALTVRRAIAFRAMLEIDKARAVVNVGVGMPEARTRIVLLHNHSQALGSKAKGSSLECILPACVWQSPCLQKRCFCRLLEKLPSKSTCLT